MSKGEKQGDYFPLSVEYEERFYAAGQILGSRFVRREGRPSDEAILSGRIVDRTIRPLFDGRMRYEVQVIITVLAIDDEEPDILAINAASLALATSDIPWGGPVSGIRVAYKNEKWSLLPPLRKVEDEADAECIIVACGKEGNINMIELEGNEVPEAIVNAGLKFASEIIEKIQNFQTTIIAEIGKPKRSITYTEIGENIVTLFQNHIASEMEEALFTGPGREKEYALKTKWMELVATHDDISAHLADAYFENAVNDMIHTEAIEHDRRPDGRGFDEVRPLFAQAGGISPVLHGAGVFYRGATHILSVLTLGGPHEAQVIDGMEVKEKKRFMHHYNFPPFSSGEVGRVGGTNRRMIGHGALAEKALRAIIPEKEVFPYTIRIVSEAFSSNGSTSMGSVCGSTLALLDAGVPIKQPVAGIASGLMMGKNGKYKVLTDIQGPEDHHGDMDFKVAGTRNGVTAIQMDVKVDGVTLPILAEAFEKAKAARLHILDVLAQAISEPRKEISPYAPKIVTIVIKPDQIGMVIGPGGKTINAIREETGAEIDIEDDGTVFITGRNGSADQAKQIIADMTHEYKAGERAMGTVTRIVEFGVFVKIAKNTEGLVHVSEMASFRVENPAQYLKIGQEVPVIVKEIDEKGRVNLSIKRADPEFIKPNTVPPKTV
jgi:polyribonucleotide nucleotidyltransferase